LKGNILGQPSEPYGPDYYAHHCGPPYDRSEPHWLRFFGNIADTIIRDLKPHRVLDVGCAKGFLVEALRDRGAEAWGFDISDFAISEVRPDIRPFCWVGGATEPIKEDYDLVTCIEVLEHLPEPDSIVAVRNITARTSVILFSSTPADFAEPTHLNVRPILYWLKLFRDRSFAPDPDFACSFVSPQAVLLRRSETRASDDALYDVALSRHIAVESAPLQRELAQSRHELTKIQHEMTQAQHELTRVQDEMEQAQDEMKQAQDEMKQTEHELAQTRDELTTTKNELAQSHELSEGQNVQLQQHEEQLHIMRVHVANIESSVGWRVTMAFRIRRDRLFPMSTKRRVWADWLLHAAKAVLLDGPPRLRDACRRHGVLGTAVKLLFGKERLAALRPAVAPSDAYQWWIRIHEQPSPAADVIDHNIRQFRYRPKISLVMPVYNTPREYLENAINSVRNQTYKDWELCICDDGSTQAHIHPYLNECSRRDPRIRVTFSESNQGISAASNAALQMATGEFVGLVDHDDELNPMALYEVVKLLQEHPEADIIYSDEDKLEDDGRRSEPFFKPDWSPEYLLSINYVCHFGLYRKQWVDAVGGFRSAFDGSQDYDLVLRIVEKTQNVFHIPQILYHWRKAQGSSASTDGAKDYSLNAGQKALQEHMDRRGIAAEVLNHWLPNRYRVRPTIIGQPLVSIIIPTKDGLSVLQRCVHSIESKTTYSNYEILIIDNGSTQAETLEFFRTLSHRVISLPEVFNFSRLNNVASQQAKGSYFLFLNNDTEVISPEWLSAMLELCQDKDVGIVGAKLYYPDGTIQHGGVVVGLGGVAGHSHKRFPGTSRGYFDSLVCIRNYSAVTAACMLVRRDVFEAVGGFDEDLRVAFNDVDFCMRVRQKGFRIVWTPYAELFHHESATRGYALDAKEIEFMKKRWDALLLEDPYYSPNLTLDHENFAIRV
jgi:GT2 family glycosyltransferase/SAM-dependent methyltransferase